MAATTTAGADSRRQQDGALALSADVSVRGWALWGLLAGIGALLQCGYVALWALAVPTLTQQVAGSYNVIFAGLFALYLLGCYIVLRHSVALPGRSTLVLIAGVALLSRAVLVFAPPTLSDDMYRYIWDGRVQAAGISPYAYSPGAAEVAALRLPQHELWDRINRKSAITIYPPGAELFYAALYSIAPDSITATKGCMVVVDLASCAVLLLLLLRLGLSPLRTLIYAWAPLPVIEFGGSGHVEALSVLLTLLALLAGVMAVQRAGGGKSLSGWAACAAISALAAAALVKLIPLLLLASWRQRFGWRLLALCVGLFAVGYAWFVLAHGGAISPFLATYLGAEANNSPLYGLLSSSLAPALQLSDGLIRLGLLAALALVALALTLKREHGPFDFIGKSFLLVFAYLMLATSAYPWYAAWLLLFVPLFLPPRGLPVFGAAPEAAGVRLSSSYGPALAALLYCGLTFITGYSIIALRVPAVPLPLVLLQLGVILALGLLWPLGDALIQTRRRRATASRPAASEPVLLNEGILNDT